MSIQSFVLISLFFLLMLYGGYGGFDFFTHTLQILQICNSIALIFGTNEERIMVDSCTKFVVNLRDIQRVTSIYSCKKDQTSVMATG